MEITTKNPLYSEPPKPWYSIIVLVLMFFAGMFIGQFLGLFISIITTDLSLSEVPEILSLPLTEEKKAAILMLQGLGAIGGFIIAGLVYLVIVERIQLSALFNLKQINLWAIILTIIIVISFMFVNTVFIEWNMNFSFPGFLSGFEEWAREKEEELKLITDFLTEFNSFGQFIIVFIIVAVIPGIGE